MDGYAIKADNVKELPTKLQIIGEVPAGYHFPDALHNWEAVRIFTGAPVPEGADTVVMQEKTERDGAFVSIMAEVTKGSNIREAGQDFKQGEVLLEKGTELTYRHLALAASMNHAVLPVYKRPVIAILSTGDELVLPGETPTESQIIAANNFAIASFAQTIGADIMDLGIARDDLSEISATIAKAVAAKVDCLITIGGVSVGDHDFVQDALKAAGMDLTFWRIAMRPGKPLLAGKIGATHVIGLPWQSGLLHDWRPALPSAHDPQDDWQSWAIPDQPEPFSAVLSPPMTIAKAISGLARISTKMAALSLRFTPIRTAQRWPALLLPIASSYVLPTLRRARWETFVRSLCFSRKGRLPETETGLFSIYVKEPKAMNNGQ